MPKIKNKKKLVRRADSHKKADHYMRGVYMEIGDGNDFSYDFKGCAIGCLATPTAKATIKKDTFLKKFWNTTKNTFSLDQQDAIKILKKDFGIAPSLTRVAEYIFESYDILGDEDSDKAVYEWPSRFARALPEGKSITNRDIAKFIEEAGGEAYYLTNGEVTIGHAPEDIDDKLIDWLNSKKGRN